MSAFFNFFFFLFPLLISSIPTAHLVSSAGAWLPQRARPAPPSSELTPRLLPPSSPVPPSSELAPRPRGASFLRAHPVPTRRRRSVAGEAACLRSPRGGPRGADSRPRGGPRGNVLAPLGSSIFELLRARPSSSHPLPRGREAGAHPRSGGASRRLTGVAGPEAEPARTAEVAGAGGGGHRVGAEPARLSVARSGRSPRFFLDSGESLLLPSSSTAASPCSSSRSSHTRVRAMQHSSHEDRPRPLFFEGRTVPGSSANIRSWDVLIPA